MKGFLTGLSKLVLGVVIALLLLSLAGVATARYFMARLSVLPPKPVFTNDNPPAPAADAPAPEATAPEAAVEAPPAEPAPTAETPPPEPEPEPGSYQAVVVQPIGLVLREGPGTTFSQIGGVDYNQAVTVLEASPDESWIRIRIDESGQEGWVKAGNTRQVN